MAHMNRAYKTENEATFDKTVNWMFISIEAMLIRFGIVLFTQIRRICTKTKKRKENEKYKYIIT